LALRASADRQDFVEYWAAGRLNARGANPYDAEVLYAEERQASPALTDAIMMWNPPWTLTLVLPFAALPVAYGHFLWILIQLLVVLACSDWLWRYYGGSERCRWLAWILGLAFVPSYFTVYMGQISALVLLGVVGILYFDERGQRTGRYAGVGAAAVLAALKPHMVLLVGVALLLWAVDRRRWSVLGAGVAALGVGLTLPLACNPQVLFQYWRALAERPPQMLSPTLGSLLRLAFGTEKLYVQFLPSAVGLGWLLWYWAKRRPTWEWRAQLPLLLLVSFLTTSYGAWPFDLVVLLVPVLQVAAGLLECRRTERVVFGLTTFLAFDALALWFRNVSFAEQYWHAWMTPFLLYAYLALRRDRREEPEVQGERHQAMAVAASG
jgi:hypothetical protein